MNIYSSPLLKKASHVHHGFLGRKGGVSTGFLSSLNVIRRKEEAEENLAENQKRVLSLFSPHGKSLVFLNQVHGKGVIHVNTPWEFESGPEGDALITKTPGIALAVRTADCAPILLADPKNHIVAAIHGGWRGLAAGIVKETIKRLQEIGADLSSLMAAIGPCIHQPHYEVGTEVFDSFLGAEKFFLERGAKYMLDLPGLAKYLLIQEGLYQVDVLRYDTYQSPELFFSCRRAAHQQEPLFGDQASVILLESTCDH